MYAGEVKNMWISCQERLPDEPGLYPVLAPSADPERPVRQVAWFEPHGTRNIPGWQLCPSPWVDAITHWMEWPDDPAIPEEADEVK